MLVEEAVIPPTARRVRVSVLCLTRDVAGKVGIGWPDPRPHDLKNWAVIIPGRPSVCYLHVDLLQPLPESE